jgi:hypothetical protein
MTRAFLIAVATVFLSASAADFNSAAATTDHVDNLGQILTLSRVGRLYPLTNQAGAISAQCCKICHKGKACGDTCISRQDTCHVGPGCACDG